MRPLGRGRVRAGRLDSAPGWRLARARGVTWLEATDAVRTLHGEDETPDADWPIPGEQGRANGRGHGSADGGAFPPSRLRCGTGDTEPMTDSEPDPTLCALAKAAARTSDAGAELRASVAGLWLSARTARTAGSSVVGIGRELIKGRARARHHRAQNRIRPSIRLAEHSAEVIAAAAACGLSAVRVFGSCVRGTDTLSSDVDLIVTTREHTSLLDLAKFVTAVADLLSLPEERVDVYEDDALRPGSDRSARIAAEYQPLNAWKSRWPRLESLPGWQPACAAGATEEELVEAAECGLRRWGDAYTEMRYRPEGRPAGAALIDPGEVAGATVVLTRYAAARGDGLDHAGAIMRVVITPRQA